MPHQPPRRSASADPHLLLSDLDIADAELSSAERDARRAILRAVVALLFAVAYFVHPTGWSRESVLSLLVASCVVSTTAVAPLPPEVSARRPRFARLHRGALLLLDLVVAGLGLLAVGVIGLRLAEMWA